MQRRAGADAFLTGHNGDLGGDDNVCDGLGVGGCGVVSGDVDDVGVIGGSLGHGGDVVRIGEGIAGNGVALLGQVAFNDIALVDGVRLCTAVEQTDALGIREEFLVMACLLVQRSQVEVPEILLPTVRSSR